MQSRQKQLTIHQISPRSGAEYYASCPTCEKHPNYSTLPVTLHRGGKCLICLNLLGKIHEREEK